MSTVPGMSRLIGMSPDKGADGEENEGNSKEVFNHIARGIKQIYNDSVKPVEEKFLYSRELLPSPAGSSLIYCRRLSLASAHRWRDWCQAYGDADGAILSRQNHFHYTPARP